jgi:hypothetical protein
MLALEVGGVESHREIFRPRHHLPFPTPTSVLTNTAAKFYLASFETTILTKPPAKTIRGRQDGMGKFTPTDKNIFH